MTVLRRAKTNFITPQQMNKWLKYCKENRLIQCRKWDPENEVIRMEAIIEDYEVAFKLIFKYAGKVKIYQCFKDDRDATQVITGSEAYRCLCMYYKVPKFKVNISTSPFLWKNDKYEKQWLHAYSYDLNSAYAYAMLGDFPNTTEAPKTKKVAEDEIGFDEDGNLVKTGNMALYVFKKIPSPFVKFVKTWYKRKLDPKTRQKAKNVLTYSVGYLQLINPFFRATIVSRCNQFIQSLIDENTVYCNTDSITSIVPREDLKIGDNVGEWKIEHVGDFAFNGFNYQWKNETVAYRHIPKTWFPKGWDITKDPLPPDGNKYHFDLDKCQLIKRRE